MEGQPMKSKAALKPVKKQKKAVVSKRRGKLAGAPGPRGGRPCHLCSHPELRRATADIANGMPMRAVGKKYGCSVRAVFVHIHKHMGLALLQTEMSATVLDQLRGLQRRTDRILAAAEKAKDLNTALRGVHEARENLMGIARLTGEDKSRHAEATRIEVVYVDKAMIVQPPSRPAISDV
jgi:hypothetical protein